MRKFVFEVRKMDAEVRKSPRGVRSGKSVPKKKENRMNEKITGKKKQWSVRGQPLTDPAVCGSRLQALKGFGQEKKDESY